MIIILFNGRATDENGPLSGAGVGISLSFP
jgi:hypothetical protein